MSKKKNKNDRRTGSRGQQGFSLIEVMISIVILTVGLLSLAQMMVVATSANAVAGRRTASAGLAKQQLELLKAAPFYTDPANLSIGVISPVLNSGGSLTANAANGAGVNCFQYYDADGQPVAAGQPALYLVRWQITRVIDPEGALPLAMLRIAVRCLPAAQAGMYLGVGEAAFVTYRSANVG